MYSNCNIKQKHLIIDLRKLIEMKKENKSNIEISKLLSKNYKTINNKIKRCSIIQRICKEKLKTVCISKYIQVSI